MKIYVASSWRNERQPEVVRLLRAAGMEVYDFRNPPEGTGFAWREIDPAWETWTAAQQVAVYEHPLAVKGFKSDFDAMRWADACVMVQPSGRSAALELGWFCGAGKKTVVLMSEGQEPELMLRLADHLCLTMEEVLGALARYELTGEEAALIDDNRLILAIKSLRERLGISLLRAKQMVDERRYGRQGPTLHDLQEKLLWRSKYSAEFEASPPWRHFGHSVLHITKAQGHLAELVDELDHNGDEFAKVNADNFKRDYGKYVADLVIIATRLANEFPGGKIDLETVVAARIQEKNMAVPG